MNNIKNLEILTNGMYLKIAEMVIQVSSIMSELIPEVVEETLNDTCEQLEPMRESMFTPYTTDIDALIAQGAFDKADLCISDISKSYPDLTRFDDRFSPKDLVAYNNILSLDTDNNPVKAIMALFDDLYTKMDKDING